MVNFTAGLVPISFVFDLLGRITKRESLGPAAWWTLLFATLLTPATALTGWFWKGSLPSAALPDDLIFIHQWLGSALAVLFVALTTWRGRMFHRGRSVGAIYLLFAAILVSALAVQGNLGGTMVFRE